MKRLLFALLAVVLPVVRVPAQTITFEDATCHDCGIPPGYHGLNWANFYFANTAVLPPSGYVNGVVSGTWVAFNANGTPADLLQGSSPFTLNSGYFTAAWNDGLTLNVTGYVGGIATDFASFILNTSGPQLLTFDWTNLDDVFFVTSGGTNAGYIGTGTQFALDNLTVDQPVTVPEPASMTLFGTGLVSLYGLARRRRSKSGNSAQV